MMFLDCPAYLGNNRAIRCGLPAEVRCRYTMRSTDGPIECAMIGCPVGHYFNAAIESLTWDDDDNHDPATAGAGSRAGGDGAQRGHDGRQGGGSAIRQLPASPERDGRRPNTAPAYFLGRPAALYLSALRSRPKTAAARYPVGAAGRSGRG
jgi:hypothetical protein